MNGFRPRPGQTEILAYQGGLMGVSAVPGSGKTATIAALTAQIVSNSRESEGASTLLSPAGRVLVVTYQTAAVDNLRTRIRQHVGGGLLASQFDVRTLHSLSHGILKSYPGQAGTTADFQVVDDRVANDLLNKAVQAWNATHVDEWQPLGPTDGNMSQWEQKWTEIATAVARRVIGDAKNLRRGWDEIEASLERISAGEQAAFFLRLGLAVYRNYQQQLETMGGIDFNDMVRLAVDLLESHPDLRSRLAERWSVIVEDEAQDSVPLQEELLQLIAQDHGNWIRVGDPNQAIMSSFTASDPLSLRRFLAKPDVETVEMAVSGRSSPRIINLANHLIDWSCERHPVASVKQRAFRQQHITPTDSEDPQQNPGIEESEILFREYRNRDEELLDVARKASLFAERYPQLTLAILVPTNKLGYEIGERLNQIGSEFDERLQTSKPSRSVSDALGWIMAYTASPLHRRHLQRTYDAVSKYLQVGAEGTQDNLPARALDINAPDTDHVHRLLRSCYRPEVLVFPGDDESLTDALPPVGPFPAEDVHAIQQFANFLAHSLRASSLPVEQHLLTVAQSILGEEDMARAQQLASHLRRRRDQFPEWRLPDLAADLLDSGRTVLSGGEGGFAPNPGRISLTTMHRAKGLEWDLVYLVGVDGDFFHTHLEEKFRGDYGFLGGDPAAMASAALMQALADSEENGAFQNSAASATSAAAATHAGHVELIAERLRLLYVGITRARRYLSLSWSRQIPMATKTRNASLAAAFQVLRAHCMLQADPGSR